VRIKVEQNSLWNTILCRAIVIAASLLFATSSVYASTNIIIYDEKSAYQTKFYQYLINKTNHSNIKFITLNSSTLSKQQITQHTPSLVINLDKKSPQQLVDLKLKIPVLHTLLTNADSTKYLKCQFSCKVKNRKHHFFVLDQPPNRQLALIKLVKPNTKNIGVIYSKKTSNQVTLLEQTARHLSFNIKPFLTNSDTLGFKINDMAKSSDVLLAFSDDVIYNPTTLPQILLTSYRYRTPVIGFSKGFIKAGAVAGVVSNLNQLATQLSEALLDFDDGQAIISSGTIYPKYFSVISNRRVANSLNLRFPSDSALTTTLNSRESP